MHLSTLKSEQISEITGIDQKVTEIRSQLILCIVLSLISLLYELKVIENKINIILYIKCKTSPSVATVIPPQNKQPAYLTNKTKNKSVFLSNAHKVSSRSQSTLNFLSDQIPGKLESQFEILISKWIEWCTLNSHHKTFTWENPSENEIREEMFGQTELLFSLNRPHWANSVIESPCPSGCLSRCLRHWVQFSSRPLIGPRVT